MENLPKMCMKKTPDKILLQSMQVLLKRERERIHILAYSQKCESWWFWFGGSVNPYKVSIPPEFAPLSFTLGYGVKKIILKTIPFKLPKCSFLQDEIIKNHKVLAAFLPEIICFIIFSGYLALLKSLQTLANPSEF